MPLILHFLRRLLAPILLLTSTAGGAGEEEQRLHACFYAFACVKGQETVHCAVEAGGSAEIRLSPANILGPYEVVLSGGRILLHDSAPAEKSQRPPRPLAEAAVPAGIRRALVILFPAPAGEPMPYRALVTEHDVQGFPMGVYRVINLSSHPVRGAVGRKVVEARPGKTAGLEPDGEPGSVQPVRFEFHHGGRWNLLTETRAAVRKDRRWLMCIYQDPATGRMNIRTIPDRSIHRQPAASTPSP